MKKLSQVFSAAVLATAFASAAHGQAPADPFTGGVQQLPQILAAETCTQEGGATLIGTAVLEASVMDLKTHALPGHSFLQDRFVAEFGFVGDEVEADDADSEESNDILYGHMDKFLDGVAQATGVHVRMKDSAFKLSDEPGCVHSAPPPPPSAPFAAGVLAWPVRGMDSCTKDNYELIGKVSVEGSISDLKALPGSGSPEEKFYKVFTKDLLSGLLGEWRAVAGQMDAGNINNAAREKAFSALFERMAAALRSASPDVHLRIDQVSLGVADKGPNCALR